MKKYILAIDQGTTSTRAILFDKDQNIVNMAQKECVVYYPKPGWVEQDANEIWLSTLAVISEVIMKSAISPSDIVGIGISNQRETTVLWDKKTGLPIYRAIVWQSRQSEKICQRWKAMGYEAMVRDKTGLRIDPYFSASKIRWIFDKIERCEEKAKHNELLFGTIDSWLVWKLSGGKSHITDVSNASRTMLFNIHDGCWDDELLESFQIPKSLLPTIMPTSYSYTKTDPAFFFNAHIPICAVVGDQQAALFGQGCFQQGMVKNTYGTGGFMLMNTGNNVVTSQHGLLSTVAWKINDEITYALEGSIFVSGSLMKWMRDGLQLYHNTKETENMAFSVEDNCGVYIVPAFVGLGAPYWNEKCRASIVGLTFGVNKNHLVRAALESMAYQSRDVLEAMMEDAKVKISSLKVDGGAAANNFLLQFQSDLLQCDVDRFTMNELTAFGAASLAALACGFWKKEELKTALDHRFQPMREQKEMERYYQQWKKAVACCVQF